MHVGAWLPNVSQAIRAERGSIERTRRFVQRLFLREALLAWWLALCAMVRMPSTKRSNSIIYTFVLS